MRSVVRIMFGGYGLVLLTGYIFMFWVHYPPKQTTVLQTGLRLIVPYVSLQKESPPPIVMERQHATLEQAHDKAAVLYKIHSENEIHGARGLRYVDLFCKQCALKPMGYHTVELDIVAVRPDMQGERIHIYPRSQIWDYSAFRTPLRIQSLNNIYGWLSLLMLYPLWLGIWLFGAWKLYGKPFFRQPENERSEFLRS